ncbi:alkaline phosphatase family protein [Halocatena pleomorpha]|uniref:hypothetical protein n=1 Tax=Halocatena pleomorpha TaxID=1785090 RepID=UPI001F304F93|nr:hypothetical protein [Halocatena pleomorpha]
MSPSPTRWFRKRIRYGYEEWQKNGLAGAREGAVTTWRAAFHELNEQYIRRIGNPGHSIYEREWDVLVVLDACRVDLLREVADEYDFLGEIETFYSIASKSSTWMERNFKGEYTEKTASTAYVTGNPFSRMFSGSEFAYFDEVWRYAWDDELHTIPARPLTDSAIDVWRNESVDQMIVHYMQPHVPFVTEPELGSYKGPEDFGDGFNDLWDQAGYTLSADRVWNAYRDNLQYVLDDVELLLENLDANRVVISADHANAFGEFGFWGHPSYMLLPSIRQVPWSVTTGVDNGEYEPTIDRVEEIDDDAVTDRLRDLGYV